MSLRLSYADVDGNHTINPVTEILEVNNYYPFGLQHTGYGHIDNEHRSEEAEQYKYLDKEYENTYNLNVIETDFRQYDPALGRFVTIDLLSELAPNYTPYRYGFNNPNIFTDPTGLFESVQTALEFAESLGFNNYNISYSAELEGYVVTVIGGQFNGDQFYNFSGLLENIDINVKGSSGGSGGGGSTSNSGGSDHKGLMFTEFAYSVAGAYGEAAGKSGKYTQTNGNTGNFNDRPYNRLSKNAKAHYNFAKNLRYLKKAGYVATVVSGTIDVSNGIIQDYRNYQATGHTNGQHTVTASVKVGTGVAVGWLAGASSGAAIGTLIPIPGVGTVAGAIIGGYLGYKASEAAGSYMNSVYE